MSTGWTAFIVALAAFNILGCAWLLWWTSKRRPGDPKPEETSHYWDGDITEYNKPMPRWWINWFYLMIAFGIGYLAWYGGLGGIDGISGWSSEGEHALATAADAARPGETFAPYKGRPIDEIATHPAATQQGPSHLRHHAPPPPWYAPPGDQLVLPDDRVRHRLPGLVWRAWRDRWHQRLEFGGRARAGQGGRRCPARGDLRALQGPADRRDRDRPGGDQAGPVDLQQQLRDLPWFVGAGCDRLPQPGRRHLALGRLARGDPHLDPRRPRRRDARMGHRAHRHGRRQRGDLGGQIGRAHV